MTDFPVTVGVGFALSEIAILVVLLVFIKTDRYCGLFDNSLKPLIYTVLLFDSLFMQPLNNHIFISLGLIRIIRG